MHWGLGWTIWRDKLLAAWRGIEEAEMNKPAVIQLRLPRSVNNGVERWAKLDGTSMNQLIASAVAEKLSALETAEFFEERARRADVAEGVQAAELQGCELSICGGFCRCQKSDIAVIGSETLSASLPEDV